MGFDVNKMVGSELGIGQTFAKVFSKVAVGRRKAKILKKFGWADRKVPRSSVTSTRCALYICNFGHGKNKIG